MSTACPLWVKSRHVQRTSRCPLSANSGPSSRSARCPLYPQKRITITEPLPRGARWQDRPLVPAIRFAVSICVVPRSTRTVARARRDYPAVTPANNRSDFPKSRHRIPERHPPGASRSLQDRCAICNFTNGPARDGRRSCLRRRSRRLSLPLDGRRKYHRHSRERGNPSSLGLLAKEDGSPIKSGMTIIVHHFDEAPWSNRPAWPPCGAGSPRWV